MFADIRRLTALEPLFDDVPTPETFAEHVEPTATPNIQYGGAASHSFTIAGECSIVNNRMLCRQWCDETFPVDAFSGNVCDVAATNRVSSGHHSSSPRSFRPGKFSY